MKLTLKQARRLEKEIEAHIKSVFSIHSMDHVCSFNVSVHEDLVKVLEDKRVEADKLANQIIALTNTRFTIRDRISHAMANCGLNDLITEEASLKEKLKVVEHFANLKVLTVEQQAIAVSRLNALKTSPDVGTTNAYGKVNDSIQVDHFFTAEQADVYKTSVRKVKKQIADLVDKCAALNASQTIELEEVYVDILRNAQLVD